MYGRLLNLIKLQIKVSKNIFKEFIDLYFWYIFFIIFIFNKFNLNNLYIIFYYH